MAATAGRQNDVDLKTRIRMFDPDGTLEADCREIWTLILPEKEKIAREFWVEYGRSPALPGLT